MDCNEKTVDSLYKFLEQMKVQNETAKKSLYRQLEAELDRTFNQMVTSLVMWAIKNIPDSSSRITGMLSLLESNEEREPDFIAEYSNVNAHQRENIAAVEPPAISQEIIQLSDESIFSVSSDEDELCDCKECNKKKKNNQKIPEASQMKREDGDEVSSQLSDVTHISDSQPMLDYDEIGAIKQEASSNDSPFNVTDQECSILNQQCFPIESPISSSCIEQPLKKIGAKIRIISLKCQNKECRKTFSSREALQSHMQNAHHVLPYRCFQRQCTASFTTQYELNLHLREMHSNQSNHFQCAHCLKVFKEHSCLAHHSAMYHLEGVIACAFPRCHWTGSVRSEAMRHFHQRHVQFTCKYPRCGKTFAYRHLYSLHVKCHSDLRPYQCNWPGGCHYASNSCPSTLRHIRKVHLTRSASQNKVGQQEMGDDFRNPTDYVKVVKTGWGADRSSTSSTSSVTQPLSPTQKSNRVYQCKWSGCSYSSLSRLKIHVHVNEVHSRHKTVMVKHSTPIL